MWIEIHLLFLEVVTWSIPQLKEVPHYLALFLDMVAN
jgi:hypothetical protein